MSALKRMVVGFAFGVENEKPTVALIRKKSPEWQKGKLNGIGSKVEPGEAFWEAMRREFKEEAGVDTLKWMPFCSIDGESQNGFPWRIVFFYTILNKEQFNHIRSMEEERIEKYAIDEIPLNECVDNLRWLIPMALTAIHTKNREFYMISEYLTDDILKAYAA